MKCEILKNHYGSFFQIYPLLLKNNQIFTQKKEKEKHFFTTMLNLSWDANE
jgi:hypothetical protein